MCCVKKLRYYSVFYSLALLSFPFPTSLWRIDIILRCTRADSFSSFLFENARSTVKIFQNLICKNPAYTFFLPF